MESLQERKRKSSGSECVIEKLSKMEFFSRENPWPKCLNLNNKLLVMESSIDTEKTISNSDKECSVSSSGISSINGEEHDKKSPNLQSLEPSHVNITTSGNGEKSSDEVPTKTETMVLNSGEKCSGYSSGFISMESNKDDEESIKSLESNSVNITPSKNGDKFSTKVLTKITKMVLNSPEKCVANSSVINSKENGKDNEESTKSFESDHKDDKKSTDEELSADLSANISIEDDPHDVSKQKADLDSFAAMSNQSYSDMSTEQRKGWKGSKKIRNPISFFFTNGYFDESFIETYEHVYEMFVEFFNTNLKDLTPIHDRIDIIDKDEKKSVTTDSLFKDDDGRMFMYFWTTTQDDIAEENKMRNYYYKKANAHKYILEKPKNGYNMKISDMFVVRLNPYINEAQIVKFDRVEDEELLQNWVRECRGRTVSLEKK